MFTVLALTILVSFCLEPTRAFEYNESRAVLHANLAGAAYCPDETLKAWTCGPRCIPGVSSVRICKASDYGGTRAIVGKLHEECFISFEGTRIWEQVLIDLTFAKEEPTLIDLAFAQQQPTLRGQNDDCDLCLVHVGFDRTWRNLEPCVWQELNSINCGRGSEVMTTGHSLGAGVLAMAMYYLEMAGWAIKESYAFGMPRTGNDIFANRLTKQFAGRFFRVTHHKDPIVQLPPDRWGQHLEWHYGHVEPEVYYNASMSEGYTKCTYANDLSCSLQNWYVALEAWREECQEDHRHYMDVLISSANCTDPSLMVV